VAGSVCQPGGVHVAEKVTGGRGTWWMRRYICQQTREESDKKRKEREWEARETGRLKDRGRETESREGEREGRERRESEGEGQRKTGPHFLSNGSTLGSKLHVI